MKDSLIFDDAWIKNAVLNTFPKRVWGAWMVLIGKAGFIFYEIPKNNIYKKS